MPTSRPHRLLFVLLLTLAAGLVTLPGAGAQETPPQTGFEASNGASWTTHDQELAFVEAVDAASERVSLETIGHTLQNRPLQLAHIGYPAPRDAEAARSQTTIMFVCSQHGNEPAGREACLKLIRDLAFTQDPALLEQLSTTTILVVPAANPDGRAANTRGNSQGTDINRDHLNLETPEARAMAAVVRDWRPEMVLDLHEYGPSIPVLYDDDVLYLWPRNLNVERQVHDLAQDFSLNHLSPCVEGAGYTSDEYGLYAAGDTDVTQTAGDGDEGIARNAMGLRHSLGILVETATTVSTNPQQLPNEASSTAAQNRRRVTSHRKVIDCTLDYFRANAETVTAATATAPARKLGEGLAQNEPLYFGGADNDPPTADETVYPPPCAYRLTSEDAAATATALDLHGITAVPEDDGSLLVPMGQPAEPVIPLLLDGRGTRSSADGEAVAGAPLSDACRAPNGSTTPAQGAALLTGVLFIAAAVRSRLRGRPAASG